MTISWHGLSCFHITAKPAGAEISIVVDPYDNATGLRFPRTLSANTVAVSHDEPHANNVGAVLGKPFVIDMPGEYEVGGMFVYAIPAPRAAEGKGKDNLIFRIECEKMTVLHLGALDRELTDDELKELNDVDILLLPVGGGDVMTPKVAVEVLGQIEPRIVIPMSHAVSGEKKPLGTIDAFCKALGTCRRDEATKFRVTPKDLPEEDTLLVVLSRS